MNEICFLLIGQILPRLNASFSLHVFETQYKPCDDEFMIHKKGGFYYMNRSAIDEDAGSEILKVFELEKISFKSSSMMTDRFDPDRYNYKKEKERKGNDLFVILF